MNQPLCHAPLSSKIIREDHDGTKIAMRLLTNPATYIELGVSTLSQSELRKKMETNRSPQKKVLHQKEKRSMVGVCH